MLLPSTFYFLREREGFLCTLEVLLLVLVRMHSLISDKSEAEAEVEAGAEANDASAGASLSC